jgi:hypothetical protein
MLVQLVKDGDFILQTASKAGMTGVEFEKAMKEEK